MPNKTVSNNRLKFSQFLLYFAQKKVPKTKLVNLKQAFRAVKSKSRRDEPSRVECQCNFADFIASLLLFMHIV